MGEATDHEAPEPSVLDPSSSSAPSPLARPPRRAGLRLLVVAAVLSSLGSLLALAGVGAPELVDDWRWDRWVSLGAAVVLGLVAVLVLLAIRAMRQGGNTPRHSLEGIQAAIEIEPEVIRLIHLRTHRIGTEDLLIAAKVEFLHDLTLIEVAEVVNRIEANVRANIAEARWIYLEPDVDDAHRGSGRFVGDTVGHIGRHDPDYARLTGQVPVVAPVDPEDLDPEALDDEIWS